MLKRSLIFAAALSLISTLAAAQTSELRIGLASDPDALDPTTSGTLAARQIFTSLCDRLVFLDADSKYQPQLAKSWAFSDDMKELVFKLRENATFHDGEPVDAAAVVYNMNRHLTLPGSNRRSEISEVTSVEAVDRYTVKFKMARPFVPVLAALADRASIMVSPKAAEQAVPPSRRIRSVPGPTSLSSESLSTASYCKSSRTTGTLNRIRSRRSRTTRSWTRQSGLRISVRVSSTSSRVCRLRT